MMQFQNIHRAQNHHHAKTPLFAKRHQKRHGKKQPKHHLKRKKHDIVRTHLIKRSENELGKPARFVEASVELFNAVQNKQGYGEAENNFEFFGNHIYILHINKRSATPPTFLIFSLTNWGAGDKESNSNIPSR